MSDQTSRILRYEVPVDDQWHLLAIPRGTVLHVGCRHEHIVEFWARESNHAEVQAFRVYGTGQPTPEAARYVGTAVAPGGRLVWHLMSASTDAAHRAGQSS